MRQNLLGKHAINYMVCTLIGLVTIISSVDIAAAQSLAINSPNGKAISNVVFYLQDNSGNIIKVKVDNFSDVPVETKNYEPTNILGKYPNYQMVAYTVKAGNNKSNMGPGEGELVIVNKQIEASKLPTGETSTVYQYKDVYKAPINPVEPEQPTSPVDNTSTGGTQQPSSPVDNNPTGGTQQQYPIEVKAPNGESQSAVKVPEPTTLAALGVFGLGALLTKKKRD